MYKILSTFVFAAFFLSASAFATNIDPVNAKQASLSQDAPEDMTSVTLTQTAAGEATGVWTATTSGPFIVTLIDLNTGVRIYQNIIPDLSHVFSNLVVKHNYQLTVGDLAGQNLMGDTELITH